MISSTFELSEQEKDGMSRKAAKPQRKRDNRSQRDRESTGETECGCSLSSPCHSGAGLLESVYELVLAYELEHRRLLAMRQHLVPLVYHAYTLKWDFGQAAHLRPANKRLGLLINFKVVLSKDGITRVANGLAEKSSLRLCVKS